MYEGEVWPTTNAYFPLSRALKRERVGAHREAMGRVRVGQALGLKTLTRRPPLRSSLLDRLRIEEAPQHIAGDARDIVVVAVMGQGRRPGDRSSGEDGTAARRLEEGDVGAHLGML